MRRRGLYSCRLTQPFGINGWTAQASIDASSSKVNETSRRMMTETSRCPIDLNPCEAVCRLYGQNTSRTQLIGELNEPTVPARS